MKFESSEKKLEIFLKNPKISARVDPFLDWEELLKLCSASILKCHHHRHVSEYLLSESSLFVYDDQITIITCGQTPLYKLANFLVNHWKKDEISCVFYSRKNLFFPEQQLSDFNKEVRNLMKIFPNSFQNTRFGSSDNEHMHVFFASLSKIKRADMTFEVLMEGIPENILEKFHFYNKKSFAEDIHSFFALEKFFKNISVNDHCFSPQGYSLNAITCDEKYSTIHVNPESDLSYITFETNAIIRNFSKILSHFIEICKPLRLMAALFTNEKRSFPMAFQNYEIFEKNSCRVYDYFISVVQLKKKDFSYFSAPEKKSKFLLVKS